MPTRHDAMPEPEHIERERAYLSAIAAELAKGADPIETVLDTQPHSAVPELDFPGFRMSDPFTVSANWESDGDSEFSHAINIVPATADEFPVLPDGHEEGDAVEAARLIREFVARRAASVDA